VTAPEHRCQPCVEYDVSHDPADTAGMCCPDCTCGSWEAGHGGTFDEWCARRAEERINRERSN
jgi:hypothetical protein